MICDHCRTKFNTTNQAGESAANSWVGDRFPVIVWTHCPECTGLMVDIRWRRTEEGRGWYDVATERIYPRSSTRPPAPREVPPSVADDYNEASLVIADSPKAAAALGRRCLQHLLRDAAGVKPSDLSKEIDEVLKDGKLPGYLADSIDAVRHIGNFAAHPIKSTNSGEVVDVEPGEAEWILNTLEGLFDFYYVQPAILAAKREALNEKLADAGKPPLK